jgi:uncharacterized protein
MWRRALHRLERWFIYNVVRLFRIRSATEHIARGFSVGLVINFFPTFGLGMVISGFLAKAAGGSLVAGVIGGTILGFVWPVLFLLNMWTGSIFLAPPIVVSELDDVTPKTMDALMWGATFMTGAILNSVLVGGSVYLIIILIYQRIRPPVLAWLRRQARHHQLRFRRWRRRRVVGGPGFLL